MTKAILELLGGLHGRTGSFFSKELDDASRRQVTALSAAPMVALAAGVHRVAGMVEPIGSTLLCDATFSWTPDRLAYVGHNAHDREFRPLMTGSQLVQDTRSHGPADLVAAISLTYPDTPGLPIYAIPLPPGLHPIALLSRLGDLTVGVDFDVTRGALILRVHPSVLFPDGKVHARLAYRPSSSVVAYATEGRPGTTSTFRMRYMRSAQTIEMLRAAVAEASGLVVHDGDDVVVARVTSQDESWSVYTLASGRTVTVPYEHNLAEPGAVLHSGYVFVTPGRFGLTIARTPNDLAGGCWDLTHINNTPRELRPSDPDFATVADDMLSLYSGRLLLLTGAVEPAVRFLQRHRPAQTVFITTPVTAVLTDAGVPATIPAAEGYDIT